MTDNTGKFGVSGIPKVNFILIQYFLTLVTHNLLT